MTLELIICRIALQRACEATGAFFTVNGQRAVDGTAEQLRTMGQLSALVAGFVMVAFIQFSFDPTSVAVPVLLGFGISNALTVGLNVSCMSMCTLILASIFKTYTSLISPEEQASFLAQCRQFALNYKPGDVPPKPPRSFHTHWETFCRAEWHRALTMFVVGIVCFMLNIIFASFIKFQGYEVPAILLSSAVGIFLLYYLAFGASWLLELTSGGYHDDSQTIEAEWLLKPMGLPFDWHLPPHVTTARGSDSFQPVAPTHLPVLTPEMGIEGTWRHEDMEQAAVDNAHMLWIHFVERQRNDMDERAEHLRGFSFVSGIVAGFIIASFLQVTFNPLQTSRGLQIAFAVTVGLTATLTTSSMATCSVILLSILKTGSSLVSEHEQAHFMSRCLTFFREYRLGDRPPAPRRTFRTHWELRCEIQWYRSFYLFSLGLVFFVCNLVTAGWIKFLPNKSAPACVTGILTLALIYIMVAQGRWVKHIFGRPPAFEGRYVEPMGLPFDWYLPPQGAVNVSRHFGKLRRFRRMTTWIPDTLRRTIGPEAS
ncbi:hypothetical protein WJX73_009866 [Symbiochloris irregularis]|uniref:Uncharacterized protein n=1 Tax=Symbiochloris irregularis TaxID=706552 RepID=A0AAW1PB67_9CHLO